MTQGRAMRWRVAGFDENIDTIMDFLDGGANSWFVDAIAGCYPALDAAGLIGGDAETARTAAERTLRPVYDDALPDMRARCAAFQSAFDACAGEALGAFARTFGGDILRAVGPSDAMVTINPVCPRYLDRNAFAVFFRYPVEIAVETALHEACHFYWFAAWRRIFRDDPALYESPRLPWMLSEMAVDPILSQQGLRGHTVSDRLAYPCFYGVDADGRNFMEELRRLFRGRASLEDFMRRGFALAEANAEALHAAYGQ